jgi:hypothetical protein
MPRMTAEARAASLIEWNVWPGLSRQDQIKNVARVIRAAEAANDRQWEEQAERDCRHCGQALTGETRAGYWCCKTCAAIAG